MRKFALIPLLALTLVYSSQVLAGPFTDFPGAIPKDASRTAATDLVLDGRVLTPDEADQLRAKGTDLSAIDPQASDIWSAAPQTSLLPALDVKSTGETFEYLDVVASPYGMFRFSVSKKDAAGVPRTYTIVLSKKVHNVLLRQGLLRKLGYQVPEVKRLRNFTVRFTGAASRMGFVDAVRGQIMLADPKRWILNSEDKNAMDALLQDAVIVGGDNHIYNLADGLVPSEVIQGRRVLNALLVPYNLVDVPESVNLFTWHPGRITNDMIYLPYDDGDDFFPSHDDARWIARRIAKLSRTDFEQIVAGADLPAEVAALMTEKIVARRNMMIGYMGVTAPALKFDPAVSRGANLVNGKLTKQDWTGYGSRFAFGDPVAPLSGSEIRAFFKSRAFGTVVDNLISQFNLNVIPHSDINQKIYDHQVELAQQNFLNYLKTGQNKKTPFGFWTTPIFAGNLIVSRDVVTGSYLGTDNLVQLADSFGFSVEGGLFIGIDGLPAKLGAGAQAKLSFTRTYTHIKPIKSVKAALKEPYRNMAVPLLKNDFAEALDKAIATGGATDEKATKALADAMEEFKKLLAVNDSLLIQDSVSGLGGIQASYGLAKNLSIHASLADSQVFIRRLQIYRKDADTIQVYRDPADYNVLSAAIGFNAYIPVFEMRFSRKAGEATTYFYELNVKGDLAENPGAIANIKALRSLLVTNSTDAIEGLQKPFQITHKFLEKETGGKFLLWRWLDLESNDRIRAIHPGGQSKDFLYWSEAKVNGKSYEALSTDILSKILEEISGSQEISIATPGAGQPGQGIYGSSVSRRAAFEAELLPSPSKTALGEQYVDISYEWRGWEISRKDLEKIIKDISTKFSFQFYPPQSLQQTKKVQLYSVELKMSIYQAGIEFLSKVPVKRFEDTLTRENKYERFPETYTCLGRGARCERDIQERERNQQLSEKAIRQFRQAQKKYVEAKASGDINLAAKQGLKMISATESVLSSKGFIELIGGQQNIFVQSAIQGFRVGDEAGDTALISSTLGQIGSSKRLGPLRFVQENLGMTESEFFIYWLINKI
ncbi:MAG: hypothetical protein V4760_13530 [Bdellovibrionota bacterium]